MLNSLPDFFQKSVNVPWSEETTKLSHVGCPKHEVDENLPDLRESVIDRQKDLGLILQYSLPVTCFQRGGIPYHCAFYLRLAGCHDTRVEIDLIVMGTTIFSMLAETTKKSLPNAYLG